MKTYKSSDKLQQQMKNKIKVSRIKIFKEKSKNIYS